jgi:acyl-CoA reductase-like NAD-dependent aldehyde dehydrogenase
MVEAVRQDCSFARMGAVRAGLESQALPSSPLPARGAPASAPPSAAGVVDEEGLGEAVATVAASRERWASTSVAERIGLLERVIADTLAAAPEWIGDVCRAQGIEPGTSAVGEEWGQLAIVVRNARLLRESLRDIGRDGRPKLPGALASGPGGRVVAPVFPAGAYDRMLFPGTRAGVWMPPGRTAGEVSGQQAWAYREPRPEPVVELVLGAGNFSSIAPRDLFYGMFVENRVAVLKCNPVNDYLARHWERSFRALVEGGFLRIVKGDAAAGAYLVGHPDVGHIHITGSDKTFEAVVFGPGPDGVARKARGERLVGVPVTVEGGNVSPVVIVPGRWSASDLGYQAAHVATMLATNAGFNCNAVRVVITAAAWPQREAFLDALEHALASLPPRQAYYPGAADRYAAFLEHHPDASRLGNGDEGTLPWTLVRGADPHDSEDPCFTTEAFCSLMAETALPGRSANEFLDRAVKFCNDTLWGTLCASLIVKQRRDAEVAAAVQRAVRDLRYGSVCVNAWPALPYALNVCSWGAYPGHSDSDIQSGRGTVANTFMLRDPEKSVVHAPFRYRPRPAWFSGHKNSEQTQRALAYLWANPSPVTLTGMFAAALRP